MAGHCQVHKGKGCVGVGGWGVSNTIFVVGRTTSAINRKEAGHCPVHKGRKVCVCVGGGGGGRGVSNTVFVVGRTTSAINRKEAGHCPVHKGRKVCVCVCVCGGGGVRGVGGCPTLSLWLAGQRQPSTGRRPGTVQSTRGGRCVWGWGVGGGGECPTLSLWLAGQRQPSTGRRLGTVQSTRGGRCVWGWGVGGVSNTVFVVGRTTSAIDRKEAGHCPVHKGWKVCVCVGWEGGGGGGRVQHYLCGWPDNVSHQPEGGRALCPVHTSHQ